MITVAALQGACLYLPVTHRRAAEVIRDAYVPGLGVLVLCLEDALRDADVTDGIARLEQLPSPRPGGPKVYVRVRSPEMLETLADSDALHRWSGIVVPKCGLRSVERWMSLLNAIHMPFMPIIETMEVFDPVALRDLVDVLTSGAGANRLECIRFGATDLAGLIGARKPGGCTWYETLIGPSLSMAAAYVMARGTRVSAPVSETLVPDMTFVREVDLDVANGFIGKSAAHPSQVAIINRAYAVSAEDLDAAQRILYGNCAVFAAGTTMCEQRPHRAWADRVVARAERFGVREGLASRIDGLIVGSAD